MKILVTGGAGFIGSNFVRYMLSQHNDVEIVNFDALTYAGNLENLKGFENDARHVFVQGDITSFEDVEKVFEQHKFNAVVNFAAESHVDRSLHLGADAFIKTNILGSSNVIEAALDSDVKKVLALSTDKAVNPINLYGATKLAAEKLFIQSNAYAGGMTRYWRRLLKQTVGQAAVRTRREQE